MGLTIPKTCSIGGHVKNEIGNNYGRLTVLRFAYVKKGYAYWECRCSCNDKTVVVVNGCNLRRKTGGVKSCGCLQKEQLIERNKQPILNTTRKKLSEANSGENNNMFGRPLLDETKRKLSKKK